GLLQRDVLDVDLRMTELTGLDVLKMATAERLSCRCVLLTAAITDEEIVEAMRHGTSGLVLKESAPDHLIDCIRGVLKGKQWIDQEMVMRAFRNVLDHDAGAQEAKETLTPRELEIVRMVAA